VAIYPGRGTVSVTSVARKDPTRRSRRCSVCSVLRLEKRRGHRGSRFACGRPRFNALRLTENWCQWLRRNPSTCHPEEAKPVLSIAKEGPLYLHQNSNTGLLRCPLGSQHLSVFRSLFGRTLPHVPKTVPMRGIIRAGAKGPLDEKAGSAHVSRFEWDCSAVFRPACKKHADPCQPLRRRVVDRLAAASYQRNWRGRAR
jgi:hypothetical protein